MNKCVYCEFSFLKEFTRNIPRSNYALGGNDQFASWKAAYNFLKRSSIYVDASQKDIMEEVTENKRLLNLFQGRSNWHFMGAKFPQLDKLNIDEHKLFFSVFFCSSRSKKVREEISSRLGVLILGPNEVKHFAKLIDEKTFAVAKLRPFTWNELSLTDFASKSNSMIIVDNYILENINLYDKNIKPLLQKLIPSRIGIEYHITIFTNLTGKKPFKSQEEAIEKSKNRYNELKKKIQDIFVDLKKATYTISVIDSEEFHDRIIITNNAWIDCGSGFDLINENGNTCKRTNIRIAHPFMSDDNKRWVDEAYILLLCDCLKASQNPKNIFGDKTGQNRLMTLIE